MHFTLLRVEMGLKNLAPGCPAMFFVDDMYHEPTLTLHLGANKASVTAPGEFLCADNGGLLCLGYVL